MKIFALFKWLDMLQVWLDVGINEEREIKYETKYNKSKGLEIRLLWTKKQIFWYDTMISYNDETVNSTQVEKRKDLPVLNNRKQS